MAILWQKTSGATRYEVRSAGRTRRLYTNGVFHSQYNPKKALSGGIWDLLLLPIFFAKPEKIKRVLVLGVGGGTVIQQLKRYSGVKKIIGVELNPIHILVARKYFGVKKSLAELHHADAVHWLKKYQGPPFDLIIEDLFGERNGEPLRAVPASSSWMKVLNKNLARDGILVMNFIGTTEIRHSGFISSETVNRKFKSAFQFTLPMYENVIAAFLKFKGDPATLRNNIEQTEGLNSAKAQRQLNFRVRKIRKGATSAPF
jgi:spermidine synthase